MCNLGDVTDKNCIGCGRFNLSAHKRSPTHGLQLKSYNLLVSPCHFIAFQDNSWLLEEMLSVPDNDGAITKKAKSIVPDETVV